MVRVTDLGTGVVKMHNLTARRVMRRAVALYDKAKKLGIPGVYFSFYLKYSWDLEKGKIY